MIATFQSRLKNLQHYRLVKRSVGSTESDLRQDLLKDMDFITTVTSFKINIISFMFVFVVRACLYE